MKTILILILLLVPTLGYAGGAIVAGGFNDRGIQLTFDSDDAGIDVEIEQKLFQIIVGERAKRTLTKVSIKLDGPSIYCLEFKGSNEMGAAFSQIEDLVRVGRNVSGQTVSSCP